MIDGSKITAEDILENQRYLKGYLLSKVPEADLSDGSFFNDVVVRSMSYVLALFEKEAGNIKSRMHVDNVSLSEDSTSSQILDNIASNFFITRNEGNFSYGTIRVEVSSNSSPVVIQPQTRFTKSSGVNFMYEGGADEATPLIFSTSELKASVDSSGLPTGTYFVDVPVAGEVEFIGSELAPGLFESSSPSIPGVVSIRNLDPFTLADSLESNYEFSQRIKSSLTHRGFSSSLGIKSHLLDTLTDLSRVTVIGATSPMMRRDTLRLDGVETQFKTLGKANVYFHSSASKVSRVLTINNSDLPVPQDSGLLKIPIGRDTLTNLVSVDDFPQNRVDKIVDSQGAIVAVLENNISVGNSADYVADNHLEVVYDDIDSEGAPNTSGYLFSRTNLESLHLLVPHPGGTNNLSIQLDAVIPNLVIPVESELYSDSNSVPNLDILAYSSTVKRVYLKISYFRNSDFSGDIPEKSLAADIASYVNSRNSYGLELEIPDLASHLLSDYSFVISGIDLSETSMEMSLFLPNGVTVVYEAGYTTALSAPSTREYYILRSPGGDIRRYSYLPENYLGGMQVDDSTCALVCFASDIQLVESVRQ